MRKAFIPEFWITSNIKGDALRTLVAVALHADKHGKSWVKNDTLVGMLDKDIRRVQADLNRGEALGLISRKFDEKGRRYFVINMEACTDDEKQHPPAQNDMTKNNTPRQKTTGGDDEKQQGGMTNYDTPPNNPHIGTLYSSTVSIHKDTHAREAQGEDTECLSLSNASLPEPEPKQVIPPDVQRMASQLQLESWIGELQFQNISLADWRVKETLGVIHAKGGGKNSRYAWGIFRNLPENQPKPDAYTPARQPEPMPNVMPPKREQDGYELAFTEISNRIAAAKWPLDKKNFYLDRVFTVVRSGSAESYRARLEAIFEKEPA